MTTLDVLPIAADVLVASLTTNLSCSSTDTPEVGMRSFVEELPDAQPVRRCADAHHPPAATTGIPLTPFQGFVGTTGLQPEPFR